MACALMAEGTLALQAGAVTSSTWLILPFVTETLLPDGQLILAHVLSLHLCSSSVGLRQGPRPRLLD